jgi:hypothetical protein
VGVVFERESHNPYIQILWALMDSPDGCMHTEYRILRLHTYDVNEAGRFYPWDMLLRFRALVAREIQ